MSAFTGRPLTANRAIRATSAWLLMAAACAGAGEAITLERSATLGELFAAGEASELNRTLPADRAVKFQLRIPASDAGSTPGAIVFIKPDDSGAFIEDWAPVFDARRLIWISADGFGNRKPTAQRVLVAMMARKLLEQAAIVDRSRVYLAGMSGGGRVASQTITRFPQEFAGAMYVVGADYYLTEGFPKGFPEDRSGAQLRELALQRRYVFLTGSQDFNRREMRRVSELYRAAGAPHVLFIDEAGFGHRHATAPLLIRALEYLDAR